MGKEFDIDDLLRRADQALKNSKPRRKRARKAKPKNSKGYQYVYVDGQPKLLHREVMEKHLGRKLLSHEAVYFRNGDKSDTRVENLILGLKQGIPLDSVTCPHCNRNLG